MTEAAELETASFSAQRDRYARDGFCTSDRPLLDAAAVARLREAVEAVIAGNYDTGRPPYVTNAGPDVPPPPLVKIDQPHLASSVLSAAIREPAIASYAASVTGASWLQVFAVQLLKKSPAVKTAAKTAGNVGWHQDDQYWTGHIDGEAFTVWVALSDVTERSGAVKFVPGSHNWGRVDGGSFFDQDVDAQLQGLQIPDGATWAEVPAVLSPGAASMHHRMILHGSGENLSEGPRVSLAIHMRSQRSEMVPGSYFDGVVKDPLEAPVIYGV